MRVRALAAAAATAVLVPALAACGSTTPKADNSPTSSPSTVVSSPATSAGAGPVSQGLNALDMQGKLVAAAKTTDEAKKTAGELEGFWKPIEDKVKANDPNTYTAIEDAMASLEGGDLSKVGKASSDLDAAVTAYLAKYSG